jgi:quinol monooxygenase YgiN
MTNLLSNRRNLYCVCLLYVHHLPIKTTKKMAKLALLAWLEAKPGKEQEVADFLKSALPLAQGEPATVSWFAWQTGESIFGIFDTFETEEGRDAHLSGPIAAALMANADRLLAKPPIIEKLDILAEK